jgi:glutamyl/glutaminyl-tRNA synthetase
LGLNLIQTILYRAGKDFNPSPVDLKQYEGYPKVMSTEKLTWDQLQARRLNVYYALAMELKNSGKTLVTKDQAEKLSTIFKDKLNNTHLDKLLK